MCQRQSKSEPKGSAVTRALIETLMPFAGKDTSSRLGLAARLMVETGHAAIAASQFEGPGGKDA
jgi:hypothetical protein